MLSALGLGSIVLGILRSSQWGWITPSQSVPEINGNPLTPLGLSPTLWLILIGAVLLVVFGRRERKVKDRGDEPLLDLALLKIPRMRAGLVVQWCQAFIIQATFFVLPLYLQTVLGFDSLKTGVTILPMSVAMFVFALGGSALTGRFSPKLIVQRGIAAMLVGEVVLLYFLDPQLSGWGFGIGLALLGAGLGLLASQVGNVIMSSVEPTRGGEAGGLQGTSLNLGASLGVALVGSILLATLASNFTTGVQGSQSLPDSVKQQVSVSRRGRRQLRLHHTGRSRPPRRPACRRTRPPRSWPPTPTPSSTALRAALASWPSSRCSRWPGYVACRRHHRPTTRSRLRPQPRRQEPSPTNPYCCVAKSPPDWWAPRRMRR